MVPLSFVSKQVTAKNKLLIHRKIAQEKEAKEQLAALEKKWKKLSTKVKAKENELSDHAKKRHPRKRPRIHHASAAGGVSALQAAQEKLVNLEAELSEMAQQRRQDGDRAFSVLHPKSQLQVLEARKEAAERSVDFRSGNMWAVTQPMEAAVQRPGFLGLLGELGAVADKLDAEVIARIIGARMTLVVVRDNETKGLVMQHFENAMVWCVASNEHRKYNYQMKPCGDLLQLPDLGTWVGRARYAVNLILLPPAQRELRKTLWWWALGDTLVFDKEADMEQYVHTKGLR
jgi:hypothetical protein